MKKNEKSIMEKLFKDYWEGKVLLKAIGLDVFFYSYSISLPILPALGGGRVTMFTVLWFFAMQQGGFRSATFYVKEKKKKKQNSGWGIAAQI